MASTTEPNHHHLHRRCHPHHRNTVKNISRFIQSTASNFSSLIPFHPPSFPFHMPSPSEISSTTPSPSLSKIYVPLLFTGSTTPQLISIPRSSNFKSTQTDSPSSSTPRGSSSDSSSGFPSTVRISGLKYTLKGGPAFVGQVFSMCDLSGTGLMAVSTHFDIPFISKRTLEWVKKVFASITKSERNGPVFRFFIDVGDAVSYVRKLNIPIGMVGACRLDLAYEHFKEKPHLFQFVPNEKQVKEASKLLKIMSHNGGRKRVDGVPVFSAQNLDIAIATADGIKWYTPYFFDKNLLDTILEESVDQHFHALIQTRRQERDVVSDDSDAEVIEEIGERMWEAPEDMGALMGAALDNDVLESAISEAVESKLLNAVDKVLLGNRWLRKATGIQPKFPYMVDSFEERSAASLRRALGLSSSVANSELENSKYLQQHGTSELTSKDSVQAKQVPSFRFPFGDWCRHPFSNQHHNQSVKRVEGEAGECVRQESQHNPLLPRITMVGITTREAGKVSNSNLRKTVTDLTRELQQTEQGNTACTEFKCEDRDPLFVANVDGASKKGSPGWG